MVDPNRTINLPSSSDESEEEELDDDQIQLIKHLEEKFKDRFTKNDTEFMEICKRKKKDPPILEMNLPYLKRPHNNFRGGYNRGGGYHHNNRGGYHNNRGGYNNYNNNNRRNYNNYSNNQERTERPNDYGSSKLLHSLKKYNLQDSPQFISGSSSNSKRPRFNQ